MCALGVQYAFGVIVAIAGVVFVFAGATKLPHIRSNNEQKALTWSPVPWLGVLTLEGEYKIATEGLIIVTIISEKIGIADAKFMAALNKHNWEDIRNNTHVMFLTTKNGVWFAKVEKFILHPEFSLETLTTMAILNLEYDPNKFKGDMVRWPSNLRNPAFNDTDIFTIGYIERNGQLEQTVYRMDYIQFSECQNFYYLEALDTKWMRPKHYHCYKVRYEKQSCVFDPGMALVRYAAGNYTLMGLSVWGPGCSLPTRFFDFEPFIPWIVSKVPSRRYFSKEYFKAEAIWPWGRYTEDTKKQRDRWKLERISDQELVLRPVTYGKFNYEEVRGPCDMNHTRDWMLVYREAQEFMTRRRGERIAKGIAVYSLSLYDKKFNGTDYTCIRVLAKCKQVSHSDLEITRGFGNEPLDVYIKPGYANRPSYVLNPYVHFLQRNYEIIDEHTTHLTFRFEFEKSATLDISFYTVLRRKWFKTTPTTTRITSSVSRQRRPYKTPTPPPQIYWYYKYGHYLNTSTTEAVKYKPLTTTSTTTEPPTITTEKSGKWWHYSTDKYPELDKDWWKG